MIRFRASTLWRMALVERLGVGHVADADAAARDLVFVGRPDAARGRPDLALAAPGLAQQIELAVIRQDQVRLVADDQPFADVDAGAAELLDLGEQRLRIDDHTVADDAGDALMQDPGRQQTQDELAPAGIHRMAGVVTALIARDDGKVRGQEVDDLALPLVAPLRTEYRYVLSHLTEVFYLFT